MKDFNLDNPRLTTIMIDIEDPETTLKKHL